MTTKYEKYRAEQQAFEEELEQKTLEKAYLAGWLSWARKGEEPSHDAMLDAADYAESVLHGSLRRPTLNPLPTPSKDENAA